MLLSVTSFTMLGSIFFFVFPFVFGQFVKNDVYNTGIKRLFIAVSFYLMTLTAGILLEITQNFGALSIESELITYITIFQWGGYLMIFAVAVKTIFELIQFRTDSKNNKRMGKEEADDE